MDALFTTPSLSREFLYEKLESIDQVLLKLDNRKTDYVAPHLSKDDLTDIFVEARSWLLLQLDSLGEADTNRAYEDFSSDPMEYTYRIEAMRNRIGN